VPTKRWGSLGPRAIEQDMAPSGAACGAPERQWEVGLFRTVQRLSRPMGYQPLKKVEEACADCGEVSRAGQCRWPCIPIIYLTPVYTPSSRSPRDSARLPPLLDSWDRACLSLEYTLAKADDQLEATPGRDERL